MGTEKNQRRRVTRAIKLALTRIAEKDPELARLISESIETGTYLAYTPVKPQAATRKPVSSKRERGGRE